MRRLFLICIFLLSLTNLMIPGFSGFGVAVTPFLLILPFLMFLFYARVDDFLRFDKTSGCLIVVFYMLMVSLVNLDSARWSSIVYSVAFVGALGFFAKYSTVVDNLSFERVAKLILFSYFLNSLFALLFYPLFGGEGLFSSIFQYTTSEDGRVRFHGFSSEPSYASFIVCTALLAYLNLTVDSFGKRIFYLVSAVFSLYLFESIYGYFLIFIIIFLFFNRLRHEGYRHVVSAVYLSIPILFVIYFLLFGGGLEESRLFKLWYFVTLLDFDLDFFRGVDSSAFMRVGPFFGYVTSTDFYSFSGFFGYGPGASRHYFGSAFEDAIAPGQKGYDEGVLNLGFVPAYLYDYGVVGVVLFWFFIGRVFVNKLTSVYGIFFLVLAVNANLNTQLFCFVLSVFYYLNSHAESRSCRVGDTLHM